MLAVREVANSVVEVVACFGCMNINILLCMDIGMLIENLYHIYFRYWRTIADIDRTCTI